MYDMYMLIITKCTSHNIILKITISYPYIITNQDRFYYTNQFL